MTKRSMGVTLLGVWLVATGLTALVPLLLPGIGTVLALLAVAAGLLILVGR
jgi:hypothetical protein